MRRIQWAIALYMGTVNAPMLAQEIGSNNSINNSAIVHDMYNSSINITVLSDSTIKALLTAANERTDEQKKLIQRLEESLQVRDSQIEQTLKQLENDKVPKEQYGARLLDFANEYQRLKTRFADLEKKHPSLSALREQAESAVDEGRYNEAEDIIAKALSQTKEARSEAADLVSLQALTASLQFKYAQAASMYLAASSLVGETTTSGMQFKLEYAEQILGNGLERSGKADVQAAVEAIKSIKASPNFGSLPFSSDVDMLLCIGLVSLWQSGSSSEVDVSASISSLERISVHASKGSSSWLASTNALGTAYAIIGERDKAIKAYKDVFSSVDRSTKLVDKAMVASELASLQAEAGHRKNDMSLLMESLNYANISIEEGKMDKSYAVGQYHYNRGITEFYIASETNDVEMFKKSSSDFDATMAILSPHDQAVSWAHAATNRGRVLLALCQINKDVGQCRLAIDSLQSALTIWQPHIAGQQWLEATYMEGEVYNSLSEISGDVQWIIKSAQLLEEASVNIDHDEESDDLFRFYMKIAQNWLRVAEKTRVYSAAYKAERFYRQGERLFGERMVSGLVGDEGDSQAKEIKTGLSASHLLVTTLSRSSVEKESMRKSSSNKRVRRSDQKSGHK